MMPYINTGYGKVSTFSIFVIFGVLALFLCTKIEIRNSKDRIKEESFIYTKIVISAASGFLFSSVFDSLFKIRIYGEYKICGITFYGGLIGATVTMRILLRCFKNTEYTFSEWFNKLTRPLIVFHIFGRLGCFFGGCCYGKNTNSFLGVLFPDNPYEGIYHYGAKCYPTQLFEVTSLLLILLLSHYIKHKFLGYIISYSISRFIIEFYRGDNRGNISNVFSPAQVISIILLILAIISLRIVVSKKKLYNDTIT